MKTLLLKPINEIYYIIQPRLGLGYIATILLENNHSVQLIDSAKENLSWEKFTDIIKKEQFDSVGIHLFTFEVPSVIKHIEIIKKHSPHTKVILGGPQISCDPEGTMKYIAQADFGFAGEAEIGIENFIKLTEEDLLDETKLSQIPNLVWRNADKIVVNDKQYYKNLDEIKFPAWHLMKPSEYSAAPHGSFSKQTPIAPLIASRGCPSDCAYCSAKFITGRNIRYRTPENIIEEILLLKNKYGVKEIHFEDDNFTARKQYVIDFCNKVIDARLNMTFALPNGIRLDTLDEDILKLMEKAGFYSFAVGIESGSNRILKLMNKNLTTEVIKEKIELINKHTKINITGFFMLGYISETEEEILETIKFSKELKIHKGSFAILMPFPGTKIWDIYMERNNHKVDWENFFFYRSVENLSDIPLNRLKELHNKAMREFYFRPRIILGLLNQIRTFSQVKVLIKRLLHL